MLEQSSDLERVLARPDARRALRLAAGHINVSAPTPISEVQLLAALLGVTPHSIADDHVGAFLNESDLATIADLVISGAVTYKQLAAAASAHLPQHHETRRWLDDRASI